MKPMNDNRVHQRFACDLEAEIRHDSVRSTARTQDISRGGICLTCDRVVSLAQDIEVTLTLVFSKNAASEPLALPARVIWCTRLKDGHQVGCMFAELSAEQQKYLDIFLRFLRGDLKPEGEATEPESDVATEETDPDVRPFK